MKNSSKSSNTVIQCKTVNKPKSGALTVTFDQPYAEIPVVILTPYWEGSGSPVGNIPTVVEITKTDCTFTSGNFGTNYFVNVMSIPTGDSKVIDRQVLANSILKTGPSVEVLYQPHFQSNDPVMLLTAYWKGQNAVVGYIETLDDSSASEAKIVSSNAASNYYVNYMSMDSGISTDSGSVIESRIVNKTGRGKIRVYFARTFSTPPVVSLSPWWDDANAGVQSIETLTKVTTEYFEFTSNNAATNYFVSWVACNM